MKKTLASKRKLLKRFLKIVPGLLVAAPSLVLHGSPLKTDEEIIFFPTSANQDQSGEWTIPVHAWLYELDKNSIIRMLSVEAVAELLEYMDVTEEQTKLPVFQERIKWFLVISHFNYQNISVTKVLQ